MVKYLIHRPIAVTAIFLSVLAIGLYGWYKIPISLLPDVDPPEITIEVRKNGFSSEVMERNVLRPIRQSVVGSLGLKNVESQATQGFGKVDLSYEYGTNMDLALIEVNEKIDRVTSGLPADLDRPVVKKKKPTDIPVMRVHISSEVFSITELSQVVLFEISKRFEQLKGVARMETNGTVQKSIRLTPKTDRIMAAGMEINQLGNVIERSNLPVGQVLVKDGNYEYLIQIENLIRDKASLESLIVKNAQGKQILLSELFDISESHLNPLNMHTYNGKRGIVIAIYHQPEADLFSLQQNLHVTLGQLRKEFTSIDFDQSQDQVKLLRSNINQLYTTSGLAILFAFVVFFISSKSQRLPLILGTVIPSSILIAIGTLWIMGYTLNIITLSGFILGIGLLVDNVIILIEEINQNRAVGLSVKESCIISVKNIFPALLSSTLTTVCVFIPLLALDGIASELFKEQAIALIVILGVSLALTFILIPTFYSLWIKKEIKDLQWISGLKQLSHRNSVVASITVVVLLSIVGIYSIVNLRTQDLPEYHSTDFQLRVIWNESISLEENNSRIQKLLNGFDLPFVSSETGVSGVTRNEINFFDEALLYVQTDKTDSQLATRLAGRIYETFPKATVEFGKAPNPFEMIFYNDMAAAEARIRKSDGTFFSKDELELLSVSAENGKLNSELNNTYKINFIKERVQNSSLTYPVLISYMENLTDENVITSLKNPDQSIPIAISSKSTSHFIQMDSSYYDLSTFYEIQDTVEVRTIHADLSGPYISYTADQLNEATSFGKQVTSEQDWIYDLHGKLLDSSKSINKLILASILGVLLLYLILVAQFESFFQPLLIFSLVPLAFMGSVTGLYLSGSTINTMSIIGIVIMLGIIVNDSILKIDAINRNVKTGMSAHESVKKAKDERFKPILMTSLSTVLALIPVLLSSGIATDLQKPLAVAVIGGLIVGTWSSVYILPKVYIVASKERIKNG